MRCFLALLAFNALEFPAFAADPEPKRVEWTIDDVAREALVVAPTVKTSTPPLMFVFHGHGGTMAHAARTFAFHKQWPEAVAVYMQGLNTPGRLTDPDRKKPGWQATLGDQKDRDLKFFDAVLASMKADYAIDDNRVYASGHSNGGGFTYLLWAARGDKFAAFGPCAATAGKDLKDLKPKPVIHVAGENDPLVKFAWQKATIDAVRKLDGCETEGKKWAKNATEYPSKTGTPVVAVIHPGTHAYPDEAPALIVKFFQQHQLSGVTKKRHG